jgi:predicted house-cleaning noncanonical NTP pyrophosphatase (MazG superfamily)
MYQLVPVKIMNNSNGSKKDKDEKIQLHTRISTNIYKEIEELTDIYGNKSNVIEKAVDFFKKYKKNWDEDQKIWNKARELNMLLVGKTTFMAYLSGDSKKAWEDNIATEVIEWISDKKIEKLTLLEILESIKKMWVAANYFTSIKIIENSEISAINISFFHTFNKEYSNFWANYFKRWIEKNLSYETKIHLRNEIFSLEIKT